MNEALPIARSTRLPFAVAELRVAMRETYDELIDFLFSPEFQSVFVEFETGTRLERYRFIRDVLLSPPELARRGVLVPPGILIERSAFGDSRPTLFCLKKYLPKKFHVVWENVNLTFDEIYEDGDVSREPKVAWRPPIQPDLQAALLAAGYPLDEVPDTLRINPDEAERAQSL